MDPETEVHPPVLHVEEGVARPRQRAAVERHPEGVRGRVGAPHEPLDLVQAPALLGRGAGHLVDRERPGDAAAVGLGTGRGGGHVVGHPHHAYVNAFCPQSVGRHPEVEPVTGVVAEGQHHPRAAVRGAGDAVDLLGGRRGEDVAEHGAVGETGADDPVVGGVVARPAPDDERDLAGQGTARADEPGGVGDAFDVARMRRGEAGEHVGLEGVGIVVDVRHRITR